METMNSSSDKLRVVCISDTHANHKFIKVPDADILIHSGSLSFMYAYMFMMQF